MNTTDPALISELECIGEAPALDLYSSGKSPHLSLETPLRLKTHDNARASVDHIAGSDASSQARRNGHPSISATVERLNTVSPKAERLPSFRQLSRIASVGEEETRASPTYPPPPSSYHNPAPSHSPISQPQHLQQQQYFSHPPQMSPVSGYGYTQVSPTASMQSDPYYSNSPPSATFASSGFYAAPTPRRSQAPFPGPPASLPSLTSTNSSASSGLSLQNSATDGYSTANTTPIDSSTSVDSIGRISLPAPMTSMPPPPPLNNLPGTFACTHPGCNALPFQTQYLLK